MRLAALTVLLAFTSAMADEIKVDSPIESVAMFKNGVCVVRRSVEIPGPGVYRIDDAPTPVHGTFWVEGNIPVDVQSTTRDVEVPAGAPADLQHELVGKGVTIHFKQGGLPVATGTVVELAQPKGDAAWNRMYAQQNGYYGNNSTPAASQFLVLDTGRGRSFVDMSEIASIEAANAGATVHQRRGVLLLTAAGNAKGTIHISYLTKGMVWAPSYRVELLDDKNLSLQQQAVVRNELADTSNAEMTLISGYPSIRFSEVVSPLAPSQNWANFFQQLSAGEIESANIAANGIALAQSNSNERGTGQNLAAIPAGEGVDLHFESIGKRTMAEGDSLLVPVAKSDAKYDRLVEWIVADQRNEHGSLPRDYNGSQQPDGAVDQDQPWDAVKFKNPLPFAMTTGPAMIIDNGQFAGQRMSMWVNAGEETTLHITKALSVRTRATEQENADVNRDVFFIGGYQYRKVSVSGELTVNNHRKQDINMLIRRQFSGDLVKADETPKVMLREEGVYSVNRRNEMTWEFSLKSGEEKKLTYEYTVLVSP